MDKKWDIGTALAIIGLLIAAGFFHSSNIVLGRLTENSVCPTDILRDFDVKFNNFRFRQRRARHSEKRFAFVYLKMWAIYYRLMPFPKVKCVSHRSLLYSRALCGVHGAQHTCNRRIQFLHKDQFACGSVRACVLPALLCALVPS